MQDVPHHDHVGVRERACGHSVLSLSKIRTGYASLGWLSTGTRWKIHHEEAIGEEQEDRDVTWPGGLDLPALRWDYGFSTMSFFMGPSTPSNSSFSALPTLW